MFERNRRRIAKRGYLISTMAVVFAIYALVGCGGGGSSGGGNGGGNQAPTANAGPDQIVTEGDLVNLDGSGSSDGDGNIASYAWNQQSGTVVTLNNADTATPSFTAPAVAAQEDLVFQLTVTDDDNATDTDEVTVTVNSANAPPVADAGPDQTVDEGDLVNLDGSGSSDSDGFIASYAWSQQSGTVVTLNNDDTATPSFTAPGVAAQEDLVFQLTVTDDDGATDTDEVTVTVDISSSMSVSQETPPQNTDLTAEAAGSGDWAYWGETGTSVTRKFIAAGTNPLEVNNPAAGYTEEGPNNGVFQIGVSLPYTFSWSDADPGAGSASNVDRGIFLAFTGPAGSQEGNGLSLQVDADTTPRTLILYIGAFDATGKLVAQLDDGSATSSDVFLVNPPGSTASQWLIRAVTITYRAASSTTLTVSYTLEEDHANNSALGLLAATLVDGSAVTTAISPAGGEFTASVNVTLSATPSDAAIYYTDDGTDPSTMNGTLFTAPFAISTIGDTTIKARAFRAGYADSGIVQEDFTINANSGGSLSASVDSAPIDIVDLTVEGSTDWRQWGFSGSAPWGPADNSFKNVASLVSTWTELGSGTKSQIGIALPFGFDWSDGSTSGSSTLAEDNVRTGQTIFYSSDPAPGPDGYSLTVTADTTARTLKLYVGVVDGTGKITASLDAGADPVEVLIDNGTTIGVYKVVTINFQGAVGTTALTVDFTLETYNGATSHLQLLAATLS